MSNKYFGKYVEINETKDIIANLYTSDHRLILLILKQVGYDVDELETLGKCLRYATMKYPLFEETISKFTYEVLCSPNITTIKLIIDRNKNSLKQNPEDKTLFKSIYKFYDFILNEKVTFPETKDRIMRHKLLLDCGLFGGDIMFKDMSVFVNLPDLTPKVSIGP